MDLYIFVKCPRDNQGHAVVAAGTILETIRHECTPIDKLRELCMFYPDEIIYVFKAIEYAIGFSKFEMTRTKVGP